MARRASVAANEHRAVRVQAGDARPAPWRVKVSRLVLHGLFRLVFHVRVVGRANVPRTAAIICANHLGWTEAFLLIMFLPVEPRIYVLGEREGVLQNDFRTRTVNFFEIMIPLDRDRPLEALRLMADVLRRGGSLIIFPEGNLGTEEGTIQPLQPGAAQLSLMAKVPILPVGLTGTRELWLRRPLTLRIGPPLDPARFQEGSLRERINALTAALDAALRAQLPGDTAQPRWKPLRDWLTNLF
jgi:1-acyl-sn-glycerol-3-phosphate acyltransferase